MLNDTNIAKAISINRHLMLSYSKQYKACFEYFSEIKLKFKKGNFI